MAKRRARIYNRLQLGNKDERAELEPMDARLRNVIWAARDLVKTYRDRSVIETFRDVAYWHPRTDNEHRLPLLFKMPAMLKQTMLVHKKFACPMCGLTEDCMIQFDALGMITTILCSHEPSQSDTEQLEFVRFRRGEHLYTEYRMDPLTPLATMESLPITRDKNKIKCLFAVLSFLITKWWSVQENGINRLEFKIVERQLDRLERMVALGMDRYEIGGSLQKGYYLRETRV